jgi:hypothetical protein
VVRSAVAGCRGGAMVSALVKMTVARRRLLGQPTLLSVLMSITSLMQKALNRRSPLAGPKNVSEKVLGRPNIARRVGIFSLYMCTKYYKIYICKRYNICDIF